ncbi:MAG TPA: DUF4838 domain-containing protein [Chthoniobacteraceae bacterium]|nr:DUF4838 domain-containing protein [Chthoniobacteraceae bacterium]
MNPSLKRLVCLSAFFTMFATARAEIATQRLADFRRVVVADDAPPVAQFAAEELAQYAGRVAGQTLEVVPLSRYQADADGLSFFVGEAAGEKALGQKPGPWKIEEWLLQTVPQGLVLAGDDRPGKALSLNIAAGSQLAVYTLLDETLGVKWFWPGAFGEHVPARPDAELPVFRIRRTPELIIRSYSVGYPGKYHTEAFNDEARKWRRRTRQGWTAPAVFGHSWYGAFGFGDKEKTAELVKTHPEWFALVNGKRRPPQMCTTNPEVIEHMVHHVLADRKNAISTISPSDGGGFCQCERCTALDVPGLMAYDGKTPQLSDRIFTYANEIARRVREKDPAKGVGMFAYTFYNQPPTRIEKFEPNLYLSFVYPAMINVDPQMQKEWKELVLEWKKVSPHIVMREGWGNHYLLDLPFPHEEEIMTAFSFGSECGFVAAYGEGSKAFSTQAPNTWAVMRMMWNPKQDTASLMREFYRMAYGPAADAMQAYFGTFRDAIRANWPNRRLVVPTRRMAYANLLNSWDILYPPSVLDDAEKCLEEAIRLAPEGEYGDRVAFHGFGFEYTRTLVELLRCYHDLANRGVDLGGFVNFESLPHDEAKEKELLRRAYELGEKRETLLLAHRDHAAIDEGLYAYANDKGIRQWHAAVKQRLDIGTPTRLTLESLQKP